MSATAALAQQHDVNRALTPDADSTTAMAQTGLTLEAAKAQCGCTVQYTAKGYERILWVKGYSRKTQSVFEDRGHNHRFVAGTKVWMNPDGRRGVAEGCSNLFEFTDSIERPAEGDELVATPIAPVQLAPQPIRVEVTVVNNIQMPVAQPQVVREYIQTEPQQAVAQKQGGRCGMKCGMVIGGLIGAGATYAVMRGHDRPDNYFLVQGGNATAIAGGGNAASTSNSNASANGYGGGGTAPPPDRVIPTKDSGTGTSGVIRGDVGRTIATGAFGGQSTGTTTPVATHHTTRPTRTLVY